MFVSILAHIYGLIVSYFQTSKTMESDKPILWESVSCNLSGYQLLSQAKF